MKIEEYPRPHNDARIGFHYFPGPDHYSRSDADRWVPRLEALGASWLIMQTHPTRPVPDLFLQRVMLANIEPVVIIKPEQIGLLDRRVLSGTLRSLADSGVRYAVLFDKPNERKSWAPQDWAKPALVERFVDCLAPALESVTAEGMVPVLPPLEPYGAYWDTTFLSAMLESLKRRGLGGLLERSALGMRNFANNRPLDWGKGGRETWPEVKPYADDLEGEDHRGFRLYEWYQEIVQEALGHELPMIACANGPQASQMDDRRLAPQAHAHQVVEMTRMAVQGELPATVMNHAFWLLSAEPGQPGYKERWYNSDGTPHLPAAGAVESIGEQRPAPEATSKVPARDARMGQRTNGMGSRAVLPVEGDSSVSKDDSGKPIAHYLLLPLFEWGTSRWHLSIVQDYMEAFLPTCGFSVDEARMARRVTIIGNEQGVSARDAQTLVAAGCEVERVAGQNGRETQELLRQLARNKQQTRGRDRESLSRNESRPEKRNQT